MISKEQKAAQNKRAYERRKAKKSGLPPPEFSLPDNVADPEPVPESVLPRLPVPVPVAEPEYETEEVTLQEMEYIRQLRALKSETKKNKVEMLSPISLHL